MPAVTPELEIERQLIEQLTSGESQWTYRPDLKNEVNYGITFLRS